MMTARSDSVDHYTMSFGDHLEDLRRRIILALLAPVPLSIITFIMGNVLIRWLSKPLNKVLIASDHDPVMQVLSPPEALLTKLKLSIIAAVIIAFPWILLQTWLFIRPGLYQHERRFVHFLIPLSSVLTTAGVVLMYYVMLPLMLQVLVSVGSSMVITPVDESAWAVLDQYETVPIVVHAPEEPQPNDAWFKVPENRVYVAIPNGTDPPIVRSVLPRDQSGISSDFRLATYIDFVLLLFLGIVIAFQMPLVVLLGGWMGLVTPRWLRQQRKWALFVCAIVSAIITPPDVISMIAMLVPLYSLYEFGILLLIIAPARAVAEGSMFRRFRKPDKRSDSSEQTVKPAQTDATVPRSEQPDESDDDAADSESTP